MKEWNNNFNTGKTKVNEKVITVGQQDFDDNTVLIKEQDGNVITCPIGTDKNGDVYFICDNTVLYFKWMWLFWKLK